jgi:urease accessory protein
MAEALLNLLTWFSPSFPTGGFAYSSGLEWAVERGIVGDEATLIAWLRDSLALGALRAEAVLLRRAWQGEDIAELALALCMGAERRLETTAQGEAFAAAAEPWASLAPAPYPVVAGRLCGIYGIAEDEAVSAYLHLLIAGQISAALRLIPLGQSAGLRVQAALVSDILGAMTESRTLELGGAAWAADIAGMNHETQYTRLFRT